MNTISRKFVQAALAATVLSASVAMAGLRTQQAVWIDDSTQMAAGDLGYVHNTADPNETIGCEVYGDAASPIGLCLARDSSKVSRACITFDPGQIATILTLRDDSSLWFSWGDTGCSFISVTNESDEQPR